MGADCPTLQHNKAAMLHAVWQGKTILPPKWPDQQWGGMWFFQQPVNGNRIYDERQFVLPGFDPRDPREGQAALFGGGTSRGVVADNLRIQNIWDGGGGCAAWCYPRSDGGGSVGRVFDKGGKWLVWLSNEAAGYAKANLQVAFSGVTPTWTTSAAVVPLNQPSLHVWLYNADDVANDATFLLYYGGNWYTFTAGSGLTNPVPVGTRTTDVGDTLYIGNSSTSAHGWDGLLWSLRLWKGGGDLVALLADATMNDLAWWPACEESGNTFYDVSGNGNDATLTNVGREFQRLWYWPGIPAHTSYFNRFGGRVNGAVYVPKVQGARLAADGNPLDYEGYAPNDLIASDNALDASRTWNIYATTAQARLAPELIRADPWGKFFRWGEGNNLILNAENYSFETGTGNWIAYGGNLISSSTDKAYVGTHSLKIEYVNNAEGAYIYLNVAANGALGTNFVDGRRYRVRVRAAINTGSALVRLSGGLSPGPQAGLINTPTMALIEFDDFVAQTNGGTNRVAMNFSGLGAGEIVYIDALEVLPLETLANTLVLPAQLVADGDMETVGVGSWTAYNGATLSKQAGARTGGTGAQTLRIAVALATAFGGARQLVLDDTKIFRVTGWARGDGVNGVPRVLLGGTVFWTGTASTNWQYFDISATPAAGTIFMLYTFGNVATEDYTEWDDVRVELVMSATERAIRANYFNQFFSDMSKFDRSGAAQSGYVNHMLAYEEPLT